MSEENRKVITALRFTWRRKGYEIAMNKIQRKPFDKTLLPKQKARLISFASAVAVNVLIILAFLAFPILFPESFQRVTNYMITKVVPHSVSAWKPQPPKLRKVVTSPSKSLVAEEQLIPSEPTIPSPVVAPPVPRAPKSNAKILDDSAPDIHLDPLPQDLPLGSSTVPNLKRPRAEVQTGGFGTPDGIHDDGKTNRAPNSNEFGMFDLPPGPGTGNGTGGGTGRPGVVSSTRFGNGVAISRKTTGSASVRQGLFAEGRQTASPSTPKQLSESPHSTPVEILFKPKPAYTDVARAKKVEGAVLVEVKFLATGQIEIIGVTKRLGDGLDEAAEVAARQIRFKPATEDGQPVDFTAIVHIIFQLAD